MAKSEFVKELLNIFFTMLKNHTFVHKEIVLKPAPVKAPSPAKEIRH